MPDHPRFAHVGASPVAAPRVRLTGIAVDAGGPGSRVRAAERALAEARLDSRGLAAVINVREPGVADDSAAGVCARLGLGGMPGVQALDMIDDGCGVPSSIALGASILAQRGHSVLLTVDGGAMVVGAVPRPRSLPGPAATAGRRSADVQYPEAGPRTAVEQVLSAVDDSVPIVAVVPGGLRLAPGRRFVSISLAAGSAAPIEGLLQARGEGCSEVVLVTANDHGRAAAVMCHMDGGPAVEQVRQ